MGAWPSGGSEKLACRAAIVLAYARIRPAQPSAVPQLGASDGQSGVISNEEMNAVSAFAWRYPVGENEYPRDVSVRHQQFGGRK